MSRRVYDFPPIQEVSFEVRLGRPLENPLQALAPARDALAGLFEDCKTERHVEFVLGVNPEGAGLPVRRESPLGYALTSTEPGWTCRLRARTLSLHLTRREVWPRSRYRGWDAFGPQLGKVLAGAQQAYAAEAIQRLGLRYTNKIAVPHAGGAPEFSRWFTAGVDAPRNAGPVMAFETSRMFSAFFGRKELHAVVRLSTIDISDQKVASTGRIGVLLDIDVFSAPDAPATRYADARAWAEAAHEIENLAFESLITDDLRNTFARDPGQPWR